MTQMLDTAVAKLAALSAEEQDRFASWLLDELPDGWDEDKVRDVIAHYDAQTDDEAVAEDEAGVESSETVMNVPHDLVPKVRELIAKRLE